MAEPTTIWGREAAQDIAELKRGVADSNRRLEAVEGKLDRLRADFRGTVRGIGYTICVLITVFGALAIAGGAWVARTLVEHDRQVDRYERDDVIPLVLAGRQVAELGVP
ncbi:hypothetical protein [Tautonia plasticadhaerens]|uniref:Uncharacterized protein n=1 Tax=Tautonia plasticadhaerens TaxID=2527974 RepID=A0A518HFF3_9BACT|nr:hypothetical protein [Tautonia plasticadhaerens]QDV39573.1 hypothetical protein ElP_75440 [Tautonia plasticadhaerens]